MVLAWATRLGLFLLVRVLRDGGDRRFDGVRDNPTKLLLFWTLQGVWVVVTLVPTLVLNLAAASDPPLGARDVVGWSMWGLGMALECVADMQKAAFRAKKENRNRFIRSGLWSLCRHPNYLGEILLWFGLYVSASSAFRGPQFLSVLSPFFVFVLISRVSGVPPLERAAKKKWGEDHDYRKYLEETPCLVPFSKSLL